MLHCHAIIDQWLALALHTCSAARGELGYYSRKMVGLLVVTGAAKVILPTSFKPSLSLS